MNLSDLTLDELLDLQKRIPAEIKRRESRKKIELLGQVKKMVADQGFSLDDLLSKDAPEGKPRRVVEIKYRHPKNAALTWTGRGLTPKWIQQWQEEGGKIEQLLISK